MDIKEQVAALMQGTEYGDEKIKESMRKELFDRLQQAEKEGRPLRVYCGYDPTRADLHLGHTVTMRKLRQFQDFGHEVTFLIGDYTALIGDPSDKDSTRPILTAEEIKKNAKTYADQAFRILDKERTKIRYNSEWLSRLNFAEIIKLTQNFTVQQFLSREKFKLRWEKGDPIYLHEALYAIMQGYDAFSLKADVQVGGTDQFFNIITAARKVMALLGAQPNIAICLGILPGTDGLEKMSKSMGNYVPITTTPNDMYGKIMSIPDKSMPIYSRLVTRWSPETIEKIEKAISIGELHPRDAKMKLAYEVTSAFYGCQKADNAQKDFIQKFQKKIIPDDLDEFLISKDAICLDVLVAARLVSSRSQGRRMVKQNAVKLDGVVISDWNTRMHAGILQVGKRRFIRLIET
ncbi:MAG: tyrosine--tRNA ligase [Anaerolineaceae bacterium]|nr:tyrosine--tRNA ligase [Anaerolineaceae bacterium]